jgi:hypothetical protein
MELERCFFPLSIFLGLFSFVISVGGVSRRVGLGLETRGSLDIRRYLNHPSSVSKPTTRSARFNILTLVKETLYFFSYVTITRTPIQVRWLNRDATTTTVLANHLRAKRNL